MLGRGIGTFRMFALGQKRTYAVQQGMSALLLKADIFGGRSEPAPQVATMAERSEFELTLETGDPVAQSKIEPVSNARLRKTGIFQMSTRDFPKRLRISTKVADARETNGL